MRRVIEHRRAAFTLLELVLIFTVICILFALLIPVVVKARAKQQRIRCVSHLAMIGSGYRLWATDNGDKFPWEAATNQPAPKTFDDMLMHYRAISHELSIPRFFTCPADTRKPALDWASLARTNISYFVSLSSSETYPQEFVAGDRNVITNGVRLGPGIVKVQTNVGWDGTIHRFQGNCAMGDGSIQQMSSARFRRYSQNSATTLTWAVP